MQEILEGYNKVFSDWSNQRLKINDIEREILYLQADLNAEKEANSIAVKKEIDQASIELAEAETIVRKLESDLEQSKTGCAGNKEVGDRKGADVEADPVASLEKELADACCALQSCREYYDFVVNTYEEQMKLWEIGYRGYCLRIDNLKERLKIEEALLASYTRELEEWKEKLNAAFERVAI
jgi:hypothetical protein